METRRPTPSHVPARSHVEFAVIGAGPAGLTAAHTLASQGRGVIVLDADRQVGGIAKTVEHNGFRFDLGGHRFFTKVPAVEQLWRETLGDEFLLRPRLSRIYYRKQYLAYPLRAEDVVRRLGPVESLRCGVSYLAAKTRRRRSAETFEEWVTARFGRRLYDAFFREYTEKVWGVPGSEIQSAWAVQRIKNLNLARAVAGALRLRRKHVTSLIEQFHYPRLGPGQMWEALAEQIVSSGGHVRLGAAVTRVHRSGASVTGLTIESSAGTERIDVHGVVSTMPLSELAKILDPAPPPYVLDAAAKLRYRDLVVVGLVSTDPEPFPDNWIYVHDPGIRAGRIQNFGAWSPGMTRPGFTSLGVEYFCFRGDEIWSMEDAQLVALATRELASIGLLDPDHVADGVVMRVAGAYPMYDRGYEHAVAAVRDEIAPIRNLQLAGRNGLHRYNNQDHSMVTGTMAALSLVDGQPRNVWAVGSEPEYLEEEVTRPPISDQQRAEQVAPEAAAATA